MAGEGAPDAAPGEDATLESVLREAGLSPSTDWQRVIGDRLLWAAAQAPKGVASALFAPGELAHFRRLSAALQSTVRPDGAIKSGEAGEAGRKAVAKALDLIAGAVAFKVGGLPAAAGTYGAKVGQRAVMGGIGAARARASFDGGAPRLALPPPWYATGAGGSAGSGVGLGLEQR